MLRLSTQRLVAYPQTTPGQKVQSPVGLAKKIDHAPPVPNVDPTALTRREWLAAVPGGVVLAAATGAVALAPQDAPTANAAVHAEFPSHDPDVVRGVVGASHARIDRLRELVEASPALAKAAWDWGFGDWESALGAASHMGRRDIAELLMSHGARPNLFTFAMLGNLDAVRAMIEANPGIQRLHGPHGFTLLAHAEFGGEPSKSTVAYLESLGDADIGQKGLPVPSEEHTAIQGVYAFGNGPDERLNVAEGKFGLAIGREGYSNRTMLRVGPWDYHPTGAPAVRIRFNSTGSGPNSLTIVDAAIKVTAQRIQG